MQSNFEKWQIFTKRLTSPQSWIDAGFYFVIAAALQRRVWLYGAGEEGSELFPNLYITYVGPPGLGKGIILGPVARILRHHKYEKGEKIRTNVGKELPPLFPVGADSITFEELLSAVASAIRCLPLPNGKIYSHSSYIFVLEELDSLFKRKTQDVVNFLKNAYDCKGYEYATKHQGKDFIRNLCVSFLAGTQPDFLFDARRSGLFGQGFASRTLFLFESAERFSSFHNTQLDSEQREAERDILLWIHKLAAIYGEVKYDQPTYNFLESWYRDILQVQKIKAPARMQEYYARKKVTMLKLAMAMHFAESLEMFIPCSTFVKAIEWLDRIEKNIERGIAMTGRNELHPFARRIHEFILSRKAASLKEITIAFAIDMNVEEIKQCLEALVLAGSVKETLEKGIKVYHA